MTTSTGTYDISSLLKARFQSVAEFGLDTIVRVLNSDLAAHNALVMEMVSEMCEVTTDRQRIYGTSANGEMQEVDEYGKSSTQKLLTGATVGFPLKMFQFNLGWTAKWLQTRTPADLATQVQSAQKAHLRRVQTEIKKAVFLSTNYTHVDHLVDNVSLSVKRLLNADSALIPDGPNGETFDGASHTHYTANAALDAAQVLASVNSVIEHGHGANVKLAINKTNEAAFRLLTGFVPYNLARVIPNVTAAHTDINLDSSRLDNRAIGDFNGAEVWVKSWIPANYAWIWDAGDPNKPLAFRQRSQTALQGLRIAATNDDYPLYAQTMEAEYGIGVWTRTNGVAHFFNGGAYSDPTF